VKPRFTGTLKANGHEILDNRQTAQALGINETHQWHIIQYREADNRTKTSQEEINAWPTPGKNTDKFVKETARGVLLKISLIGITGSGDTFASTKTKATRATPLVTSEPQTRTFPHIKSSVALRLKPASKGATKATRVNEPSQSILFSLCMGVSGFGGSTILTWMDTSIEAAIKKGIWKRKALLHPKLSAM
jgi:hypothetical protein